MTGSRLSMAAKGALVLLVSFAWVEMLTRAGGSLSSTGLRSLRYFTVLSNLLCGLAALIHLLALLRGSVPAWVRRLSFAGTVAVGVTLLVVLIFLGPLYGYPELLRGANLWFHLVIPVLAILDHILLEPGERPGFRDTFMAMLPTLLYGLGYLTNILVNGVGEWPDTNDWYAFTAWGLPVGICIFAAILLLTWGIALALRALGRLRLRRTQGETAAAE